MITPPDWGGAAFSDAGDGDMRSSLAARETLSARLGVTSIWATVSQIHGAHVIRARHGGALGEADAIWTEHTGLPIAVFTADCFGVVLSAPGAVGVAHAGWRGAGAGVVGGLRKTMADAGFVPERAAVGPGIGPCCFEVGSEVAALFEDATARTSRGKTSVDLAGAIRAQVAGLETWVSGGCTKHEPAFYSHREDATPSRMVSLGWMP